MSEKSRQNLDLLFSLMQDHPDLPVVPFVDGDVVYDNEFGSWMASFGSSYVDEYIIPENDWDAVIFKSDRDVFDALEKCLPEEQFDALPDSEEDQKKVYDSLPWTKAIIVNIDTPEV